MIRYAKHNNKEYIVIDSSFEINGLKSPLHVQINVNTFTQEEKDILYKTSSVAFNRHINFSKKPTVAPKKPWWKVW